ncbi:MAG: hypothetical protein SFZ03_11585 [Candidatus Melainabacteria bacterium]|nr:hypothetical protein [Candidatus Melainabacteria bacterium]
MNDTGLRSNLFKLPAAARFGGQLFQFQALCAYPSNPAFTSIGQDHFQSVTRFSAETPTPGPGADDASEDEATLAQLAANFGDLASRFSTDFGSVEVDLSSIPVAEKPNNQAPPPAPSP